MLLSEEEGEEERERKLSEEDECVEERRGRSAE